MAKTKKRRVPSKTTNDDIEERPVKKSRHTISIANDVATIEVYEMDFELADDDMIQLQVNNLFILVPEQEEGHLLLNLDIKKRRISLSKRSSQDLEAHTVSSIQHHGTAAVVAPPTAPKFSQSRDESKCGFLKLPAELRDIIYSEVFVSKNKRRNWSDNEAPPKQGRRVDPWRVEDAALSASFLRTCRQVYNEGRKWLYSENEFRIGRDWRSRGSVWESKWSCLGYESMHIFFTSIGDANMSLLRELHLHLYDATPSDIPRSHSEDRRYIYDMHLLGIVRLLAEKATNLQRLRVVIDGRKKLSRESEMPFFKELAKVKADEVEIEGSGGGDPTKIDASTLAFLRKHMQRPIGLLED